MVPYPNIDPVAFEVLGLPVRWYGLAYLTGFVSAWILGRYRAGKPGSGWTPPEVDDFITWVVIGLLAGARLGYVLFYDLAAFMAHPLDIVMIWKGGMSFHGGLIGGCLAAWGFARKHGKPFLAVTDFVAPFAPIGLMAGRLGNFVNVELWGRVTNAPWGMVFPDPQAGTAPRHPSQLYEAGLEGAVLFVVLWIYSARPRPLGRVSGLFLLCYGLARFAVEFFREPDAHLGFVALGWMSMGQALCLPMIALGAWLMARRAGEARGGASSSRPGGYGSGRPPGPR